MVNPVERGLQLQVLSAVKNTSRSVQYANITYFVFGVILFILASLLIYKTQDAQAHISDAVSELVQIEDKKIEFEISKYLVSLGVFLAEMATYFIILSLFGFCGVCRMHKGCLIIYILMILALIIAIMTLSFFLIFYPAKLGEYIKDPMLEVLRDDFRGFNSTESISMALNYMMITYQCCGIINSRDFDKAALWERVIVVKIPLPKILDPLKDIAPLVAINLTTPIACCKARGSLAEVVEKLSKNISCAIKPTAATNNMNQGCLGILMGNVRLYFLMSAIGLGFVVTFQFGSMVSAYKLIKNINKKQEAYKKEQEKAKKEEEDEEEEDEKHEIPLSHATSGV